MNDLELVLGTAQLRQTYGSSTATTVEPPNHKQTQTLLESVIAEGIEIDTAQSYGDAEFVIGATFRKLSNPCGRVTTKLKSRSALRDSADVRRSIEVSKQYFGPSVEMNLLLHDSLDFFEPPNDTWNILRMAQTDGLVGRIGVSIDNPDLLVKLLQDSTVSAVQFPANILDYRWEESPAADLLKARDGSVKTYVRSIFLQGILLGNGQGWPSFERTDPERILPILDSLAKDLDRENRLDLLVAWAKGWAENFLIDSLVIGVVSSAQWVEIMEYFQKDSLSKQGLEHCRARLPRVAENFLSPSNWGGST